MASLLQVAAGNVGGSQTEWDTAQAIMIEIADGGESPISYFKNYFSKLNPNPFTIKINHK